eukprot:1411128-Amphidinium_carterae.1
MSESGRVCRSNYSIRMTWELHVDPHLIGGGKLLATFLGKVAKRQTDLDDVQSKPNRTQIAQKREPGLPYLKPNNDLHVSIGQLDTHYIVT